MEEGYREKIHIGQPYLPYVAHNRTVFNYLPHYHAEAEVIYMKRGKTLLTADGVATGLSDGDVFIVAPNKVHRFRSAEESDFYVIKLYLPASLSPYHLTAYLPRTDARSVVLTPILDELIAEAEGAEEGHDVAMTLHANRFLLTLVRRFSPPRRSDPECFEDRKSIEISSKILDYLGAHYTEDISLADLAAYCGYSPCYLSRSFRQMTTLGFHDLVASYRIEKAKELLARRMSVLHAAMACGFNSQRTFNRSFRRFVGMTPTEYLLSDEAKERRRQPTTEKEKKG